MELKNKYVILLLTNRDSDNIGDQVIENSDIGLLHALMRNLGFSKSEYQISSRSASIITKKYMKTRDPLLLQNAKDAISQADLIVFGGAPVFNYLYQTFYERTALTLEIAQQFNKPVIFSAIGIEAYNEENKRCQRLKIALNMGCVKQITTRDGIDKLEKYKVNDSFEIGLVSDPAVFSATVFDNFIGQEAILKSNGKKNAKKKIGIFVIRANGFIDNHVDFTKEQSAKLWTNVIDILKTRGYDYELITSGNFGDEAFLDYLIRFYNVPIEKCVFNMNLPENLFVKMSEYDGVISCRLHPGIISFSMNIPSVNLIWNTKVSSFYKRIGYPERAIERCDFVAEKIVNKLEKAMKEGIVKDPEYLMSVYRALFTGVKKIILGPNCNIQPYDYKTLLENIQKFEGTSLKEQNEKLMRKFRRTYETCNERLNVNQKLRKKIKIQEDANKKKWKNTAYVVLTVQTFISLIIIWIIARMKMVSKIPFAIIVIILFGLLIAVFQCIYPGKGIEKKIKKLLSKIKTKILKR